MTLSNFVFLKKKNPKNGFVFVCGMNRTFPCHTTDQDSIKRFSKQTSPTQKTTSTSKVILVAERNATFFFPIHLYEREALYRHASQKFKATNVHS